MDNSVNTRFYIETQIIIDPFFGCNNTPRLLIPPIDQACSGVAFLHNPGAFDPDGDSLSYEFVIPFSDKNQTVIRYQDPHLNAPRTFYTDYPHGNEDKDDEPTFTIDQFGTIVWDAPGAQGEYNIAFVVKEWRKVLGEWKELGFVRRDMQILVEDCDNDRPDLIIPNDTCVVAGTTLDATIFGIDPNNDNVKIEAFSEIFNFAAPQSPATYTPDPPIVQPSSPPAELQFQWNTTCDHIKSQSYQVVFKITDFPQNGPKLVTFKTWSITVVGPAPEWVNISVDLAKRQAQLEWNDYVCNNAQTIQVWRRVDSFPYTPANCETGMPDFLGYQLIAERPANTTTYLDTNGGVGLAPGAEYCYRLVAIFPAPKGGESYMSEEFCIPPILADAPVITKVSVQKTDAATGEIEVNWLPPFDIDPVQFPPPYEYVIQRADGFVGTNYTAVTPGRLPETTLTFVDNGLDTEGEVYNYRILLYVPAVDANTPVDTSAMASSVRLEATSQNNQIEISWSAFVPWSNVSPTYPMHDIYRGPEGSDEADLTLVATVNAAVDGFRYVDTDVEQNQTYCYRVMTRGTYGNPAIAEPLENFSQIICAEPGDEEPPCPPAAPVAANPVNCDVIECRPSFFVYEIKWERPDNADCADDIAYYKLYYSSDGTSEYVLLQDQIFETEWTVTSEKPLASCYKISAVDRSGNESPLSEEFCYPTCPYYELPNIFTPNSDGCNDLFSAYSNRLQGSEGESNCPVPPEDYVRCARFVEHVVFRVYNRWGKEVYAFNSNTGSLGSGSGSEGGQSNIYIDWNGKDKDGRDLSTGVYYYAAEVTFITPDPALKNRTIKGWVHLLR
ncbi:MAG: gliding motility-associated C-terminal domain-containing protein [Bacteroidia bacterium]|nr:gliding motility-associated C-terminal domain-containing protein [Bacteroidia bacterium]